MVTRYQHSVWSILFVLLVALGGCSREIGETESTDVEFLDDRVLDLPEPDEAVAQGFFDDGRNDTTGFALKSFDPGAPDTAAFVREVNADLSLFLNLVDDTQGRFEGVVTAVQDSLFFVDFSTGDSSLLRHFDTTVCAVYPAEIVQQTASVDVIDLSVLHADWVYVETVASTTTGDCNNANKSRFKQYFRVALNYRFDASEDDDTLTNELIAVSEAEAKGQLLFGWVEDSSTTETDDYVLASGYLGYSFGEQRLVFYDKEHERIWSQAREIDTYAIEVLEDGSNSPHYVAEAHWLDQSHAMLQLGQDVFVFDASELFTLTQQTAVDVFSDRQLKLAERQGSAQRIAPEIAFVHSDTELLIFDDASIFQFDFASDFTTPSSTLPYRIRSIDMATLDHQPDLSYSSFSQFDTVRCEFENDSVGCANANNPNPSSNPSWQFITDCDAGLGCSLATVDASVCVTELSGADDEVVCDASNYRHLDSLDDLSNNASFRGYMQYLSGFIKANDVQLYEDSLMIASKLTERDIVVRFFYNTQLTDPASVREHVLFGSKLAHQGINMHVNEGNLFVSSLLFNGDETFNQCYKNYVEVTCDLNNSAQGAGNVCTGGDLAQGLCVSSVKDYESLALFCQAADVSAGLCTDDQLIGSNSLSVESADQDAKWVRLTDYTATNNGVPVDKLYLFLSDEANTIDEGVLLDARLVEVDNANGTVFEFSSLGEFSRIEDVLDTGVMKSAAIARVDVIVSDLPSQNMGDAASYFITDPLDFSTSSAYNAGGRTITAK